MHFEANVILNQPPHQSNIELVILGSVIGRVPSFLYLKRME